MLNHDNARTEEQRELMAQIAADGVCPFCKEYFTTYHPKPILKETDYWFVTENMSPYEGTTTHLIFVYKPTHITNLKDLESEAEHDLFVLVRWATDTYAIQGGSFFMRFGDTRYNGSSVEHLHAHLLTGIAEGDTTEGIKVKLALKEKV